MTPPPPSTPTPYQPPLTLQTIQHVALSSKSYRIFGLADEAWLNARNDLKKQRRLVGRKSHDDSDNNNNKNDVGSGGNDNTNGGGKEDNTNNNYNEEEREEMMEICEAIRTALQEDAGGFGTAGFHLEKVKNVQLSSTNSAMFTCTLHPNDPSPPPPDDEDEEDDDSDGYVELTPKKLIETHHKMNKSDVLLGNDLYYSKLFDHNNNNGPKNEDDNGEGGRFKLRIVISKANEGVMCKKFHDGLFDLSNDLLAAASTNTTTTTTNNNDNDNNNDNNNDNSHDGYGGSGITEDMVEGNETLLRLKQQVLDARIVNTTTTTTSNGDGDDDDSSSSSSSSSSGGNNQTQSRPILGYYVTIMLCEPHIQKDDIVIPPPSYLDKCDVINFKPVPYPYDDTICYNGSGGSGGKDDKEGGGGGVFSNGKNNICTSLQFINPGPWERANLQAFELIALDVKKALVRVEFPMFPEGCREKTFKEVYQLNARLKSGSYATVCRGTHRATGKKVAIKCVLRQDLPPNDDAAIYDEVLILSTLRHRYICPLIDFFEEVECYFLVMELMSGGDLFDRIGKRKSYTENDARSLCRKLLESVRYCHENSVAHCDMKPKNLLLADDDDDVEIKLSDFGFATRVYEPRSVTKQCGTPFFVAPEVLMRSPYDQQSDMWSVGVIMYLLLGGDLPFMGRTQKELFRSIVLGKYDFPEESWSHVSDEAKDLVKKLLVTDPSERLTSRAAIQSSWMRQRGNLLARNNLQYTSCRLKTFNARMKLRSSMLAVTAITRLRLSISNPSQFASDRSMSSLGSQRSVEESAPKRFPSFLDIPDENNNDAEQK